MCTGALDKKTCKEKPLANSICKSWLFLFFYFYFYFIVFLPYEIIFTIVRNGFKVKVFLNVLNGYCFVLDCNTHVSKLLTVYFYVICHRRRFIIGFSDLAEVRVILLTSSG